MPEVTLAFLTFRWLDAIDILIVALLLYQLYNLVRGTAAINIFLGILALYLLWLLVKAMNMQLLESILGQFIGVGVLALIVVFQQEVRRFLLLLGTTGFLGRKGSPLAWWKMVRSFKNSETVNVDAIVKASVNMAQTRTGAIIVLTRDSNLKFYISTGEPVRAEVSAKLLETIFFKNSPLHDGAVIIAGDQIQAARCVLPVTGNDSFPSHLGMRHRAAVGLSESSDALVVVVSEQTGGISIVHEGTLEYDITPKQLRETIERAYGTGD